MNKVFEIAANISTPLMLAGFIAAAFFLIIRQILKMKLFPKLNRLLAAAIIKLIIERLFILALVAMILGFVGFVLTVVAIPLPLTPPQVVQTLSGVIWDEDHKPLAGVEVSLRDVSEKPTFTDSHGRFAFQVQALKQQQIRLIARKDGYRTHFDDPTLGISSFEFTMRREK